MINDKNLESDKIKKIENEIREIVDRETHAWDTMNVDLLLSIFHHDMVWPWPISNQNHNPIKWVLDFGKFNYDRWKENWLKLFHTHKLVHNNRNIVIIKISNECDGAFAVVDIDTLWIDSKGTINHWLGRVCKVYAKINKDWKLIMHTGVLDYSKIDNK
ncbi:MAG: hypothetical protein KGD63_03135 [Candidatus Lokiarchaeota archaeon]|nr:hypothetical protein [Candidatus Lokiarchaeota archaeon]